jgi:hypothetical protein
LGDCVTFSVRKMSLFVHLGGSYTHRLINCIYAARHFTVVKSTGSAFENFVVWDEYTTLVEVDCRIFSTSVDLDESTGRWRCGRRGTRGDPDLTLGNKTLTGAVSRKCVRGRTRRSNSGA